MSPEPSPVVRRQVTILNSRGLHARASAKFVECASRFNAEISVLREGVRVSGISIMGLMMLAAAPGAILSIEAIGPEAERAVAALAELIANRFGED
jgi:phosphocarrier protein